MVSSHPTNQSGNKEQMQDVHRQQVCGGAVQVMALEIQAQQLQTILNKRANDSRAATIASDEVFAQVPPFGSSCHHLWGDCVLLFCGQPGQTQVNVSGKLLSCV